MQIYEVNSVEEAIDLARRYQSEGKYDWFRGQLRAEWKLESSLARLQSSGTDAVSANAEKMAAFYAWLSRHSQLNFMMGDQGINSFFSVIQHYGFPTHYIDFTTDPGVAGFFASDGGLPNDNNQYNSAIYCVNTKEIVSFYDSVKTVKKEIEFELIDLEVPNLWRLQAQRGKFIYANHDWASGYYPPDRIVFPWSGLPSAPSRDEIYPSIKSEIEKLLDQWFFAWQSHQGAENIKKIPGIKYIKLEDPQNLSSKTSEIASWPEELVMVWKKPVIEDYYEVFAGSVPINLRDGSNVPSINTQIINGIISSVSRNPNLRKKAVKWEIKPTDSYFEIDRLSDWLSLIWNGMRTLPYSNDQIFMALRAYLDLVFDENLHSKYPKGLKVEFGLPDETYSRARISEEVLIEHLNDIAIEESHLEEWGAGVVATLMGCQNPIALFTPEKIIHLFCNYIIPSQAFEARSVIVFNPFEVKVFGLA
jgi:hypothetical protein